MSQVVSTTTGYRNLQSYSHVYQPVTAVGASTDSISYDPAQYRRIILLDMDETERDNFWIREEIRRVLIQNELLRHRFRYSQVDDERKRAYEIERRRREEEERRRWEEELARRRLEDEERRRMEDELRRRQDDDRRRLDEDRRLLEAERRRLEEEERRKLQELQQKPVAMGRFPDPGDIIQVSAMRGENLRQTGRYAPMYVKVGFDGQSSLPYRTKSASNSGEPVWEETLPDMHMPFGARHLAVEVYEDEGKSHLIGTGQLDLRYDENTIHGVEVVNRSGERQGKVHLRYNSRHPPPPPMPPVPIAPVGETGPLLDLEIIEGRNLVDLDIIGKSDPYVQLCWGNDTKPFYTTKVSKGKNPIWKETVQGIRIPNGVQYVTLLVWDEDPGKDDFMGTHRLWLNPLPDGDMWLPLTTRENEPKDAKLAKKGNLGVINLRAHVRAGNAPPMPANADRTPPGVLDIEVLEGRELIDLDTFGKSDPYVQLCWGTDPKPFYTTKVSKGKNPVWREGVKGVRIPDGTQFLSLLVWDEDPGKDDFMGVHRLRLIPPPSGEMWCSLYPRENEVKDANLVKKGNLGEIKIRIKCTGGQGGTALPEPLPTVGPVPTRCRVTLIGAEGLAPADSNGLSDPYATISVGQEIASKQHKTAVKKKTLNPIWNETFDLHVPENETHLTFNVWDDDKLSKDDFLGQAGLDVRGPMRKNGAFFLPLRPRANNAEDQTLAKENNGLGKIRFKTEWVGLPATVPASPAASSTPATPLVRPASQVIPPPAPKPVPPPEETFEEVGVW